MSICWEAFLARYGPLAHALARSLARPSVAPEDVVQEATVALFDALRREPARFESSEHARNYFLRSVRNLAMKTLRSRPPEPLAADPPAPDPGDRAAELVRERQRALRRLIRELEPEARDFVARRFVERHTLARIAADTGVPLSTLHSRERALLDRLRKRIEALEREAVG
jgi:RNA polymerase sigma factor (sigma-70 family)